MFEIDSVDSLRFSEYSSIASFLGNEQSIVPICLGVSMLHVLTGLGIRTFTMALWYWLEAYRVLVGQRVESYLELEKFSSTRHPGSIRINALLLGSRTKQGVYV